jgi:hypothetical protein
MEEMGSTFTGVHGTNRSMGRFPQPQGRAWPVARWIPGLGGAPGVDLRGEGGRRRAGGAGVDGGRMNRFLPHPVP